MLDDTNRLVCNGKARVKSAVLSILARLGLRKSAEIGMRLPRDWFEVSDSTRRP